MPNGTSLDHVCVQAVYCFLVFMFYMPMARKIITGGQAYFPLGGWALDSDIHFGHMALAVGFDADSTVEVNSFVCPDTHPMLYPQVRPRCVEVSDQSSDEFWIHFHDFHTCPRS